MKTTKKKVDTAKADEHRERGWGEYTLVSRKGARGRHRWTLYVGDGMKILAMAPVAGYRTQNEAFGKGDSILQALKDAGELPAKIDECEVTIKGHEGTIDYLEKLVSKNKADHTDAAEALLKKVAFWRMTGCAGIVLAALTFFSVMVLGAFAP